MICRTDVTVPPTTRPVVCERAHCRATALVEPDAPRCSVCQVRLRPDERHRGVCDDVTCHRTRAAEQAEARRQADLSAAQQFVSEARDRWALGSHGGEPLWAVVPANDLELEPRDASRRERLAARVRAAAEAAESLEAPAREPGAEAETGPVHERSLRVCGACLGGCCTQGGDHAYLKPETLLRAARHLECEPTELVEHYLAAVPAEGYKTSCIFHGPHGCGLTRHLRSDTCNEHLCGGLRRLRERLEDRLDDPILVIGMADGRHVRTTTVL